MSSSVTVRPVRGVRGIGLFAIIVGILMILAGGTTYAMVTSQLRDENITVSDDAQFLGGKRVQDPLTAYAQAEVINKHALAATDGQTFAQLPQDDPRRATVMNASFLRASLFTSVVAFGVAILVVACGLLFLLIGIALRRLGRGDVSVLEVVPASQAGASGSSPQPAPVQPAPVQPAPVQPAPVRPAAAAGPVAPPERTSSRHAAPPETSGPSTTPSAAPRDALQAEPVERAEPVAQGGAAERTEPAERAEAAEPGEPTQDAAARTGTVGDEVVDETDVQPPAEPGPGRPEDGTGLPENGAAR